MCFIAERLDATEQTLSEIINIKQARIIPGNTVSQISLIFSLAERQEQQQIETNPTQQIKSLRPCDAIVARHVDQYWSIIDQ